MGNTPRDNMVIFTFMLIYSKIPKIFFLEQRDYMLTNEIFGVPVFSPFSGCETIGVDDNAQHRRIRLVSVDICTLSMTIKPLFLEKENQNVMVK